MTGLSKSKKKDLYKSTPNYVDWYFLLFEFSKLPMLCIVRRASSMVAKNSKRLQALS